MFHWFGVVQNTRGDALAGWQVGLVNVDTQDVVPIFADENSTPIINVSGVANRAVADDNGNYDFFVPSGTYTLQFYNPSGVFQRQQRFVAMFGADAANTANLASNDAGKGASLVATEGSGTVQTALNARPTSAALAASGGAALVGVIQSGTGATARTVQDKLRETVSASDFSTVQQAFTRARTVGADVVFPAGTYAISSALTLDYTGQTEEPVTQPLGVNISGAGAHNTIINRSGSGFALDCVGGTGVAAHIYTVIDGMSFTGASAKGIKLKNHAFTTLRNMTFQGLVTGLELESVLSCKFENLVFGNSTNGVEVAKGTGFSDINANYWDNCTFRNLTGTAYAGGDHSGVYFNAVNVEGCGTQDNASTGGFNMTFDGAEGSVGLTIYGGYFEGNKGGWDINLVNTGAEYVTHVLIGVNFNRTSAAAFVTNNIRSVGKNRILLIGCTFDHFNDYTPNAGRLYVNADADTQVTCIGCKFKSSVEQGSLRNSDVALGGSFTDAGASVRLPSGWSVSRSSAGTYEVTHNLNLATANYVVTAVSEASVARQVQRVVKGLNSFTIVTQDGTGAAADSAVGFLLSVIP